MCWFTPKFLFGSSENFEILRSGFSSQSDESDVLELDCDDFAPVFEDDRDESKVDDEIDCFSLGEEEVWAVRTGGRWGVPFWLGLCSTLVEYLLEKKGMATNVLVSL